jgi:predicted NAD/FAD-binding protein
MSEQLHRNNAPLDIAVIGSGISGMSAAWLLSQRHRVTLYEQADYAGGHSHTVDAASEAGTVPVDTGFIVFNEDTYPNLTALFRHLGVETCPTIMSFAASFDGGRLEYGGNNLISLFAQRTNLIRPRFWSMLRDLVRFYRTAPGDIAELARTAESLGDYLDRKHYGRAFQDDHLLPMAAAIWSAPALTLRDHPAAAFLQFCNNHGLLKFTDRPVWRTVVGGSREYVAKLTASYADRLELNLGAKSIVRQAGRVQVIDILGGQQRFDHVVLATHADQALALLDRPSAEESRLLGAFRYQPNLAVLHRDPNYMPVRKGVWSSWNYLATRQAGGETSLSVTYWMNELQHIDRQNPLFLTLNPTTMPAEALTLRVDHYEHPVFDAASLRAQESLWSLQGHQNSWYCGAYFGAGFHEDGLQAGLAVAEALGGVRRPWNVTDESGRIKLLPSVPRYSPISDRVEEGIA